MAISSFKLSPEKTTKLKDLQVDIDALATQLEKLEKVGINTSKLKAQIAAAKTLKDNLLREFASD